MTDEELAKYLQTVTPRQAEAIRGIRALIVSHDPGLNEYVITGKWLTGLIGYHTTEGDMIYAVGPHGDNRTTLHLMPYYASKTLQQRHGAALKPFLTGKSCLEFRHLADLPSSALDDILQHRSASFLVAKQELRKNR